MKNSIYFVMVVLFAALFAYGCTVQNSTRNEYFGYTNSPKHIENVAPAQSQQDATDEWVNPLKEDYDDRDNFQISYNAGYLPPYYMPVVVPWWDNNYSFYNRPFTGMYFRWGWGGWYDVYDWYSPFYANCPIYYSPWIYHQNPWWDWYGYNYGNYYRPGYGHGWRQENNNNRRNNYAIRDFGPSRGTYSTIQKPYAGGTTSQSRRTSNKSSVPSSNVKQNYGSKEQAAPKIIYKPMTPDRKTYESNSPKSSSKSARTGDRINYNTPGTNSNSSGSGYSPGKSSESSKPSGGSSGGSGGSGSSGSSGSSSKSSRSSTKTK